MEIGELKKLVGADVYDREVKSLKKGETKTIFSNSDMDIDIKKVSSKVYIFVNKYGNEDINSVLNRVCSLV